MRWESDMGESERPDRISDVLLDRYLAGDLEPQQRARIEARAANDPDLRSRLDERRLAGESYLAKHPAEQFAHLLGARLAQEEEQTSWLGGLMQGPWAWIPVGAVALVMVYSLNSSMVEEVAERSLAMETRAPEPGALMVPRKQSAPAVEKVQEALEEEDEAAERKASLALLDAKGGAVAPKKELEKEVEVSSKTADEALEEQVHAAPAPKATKPAPRPVAPSRKAKSRRSREAPPAPPPAAPLAAPVTSDVEGALAADEAPAAASRSAGAPRERPVPRTALKMLTMQGRRGPPQPQCALMGRRAGEGFVWGPQQAGLAHPEAFLELREDLRRGYWLVVVRGEDGWKPVWPRGGVAVLGDSSRAKLSARAGESWHVRVYWGSSPFSISDITSGAVEAGTGRARVPCGQYVVRF